MTRFIFPKKLKEAIEKTGKMDELMERMLVISFNSTHPHTKKRFKIGFILEKTNNGQMKIHCISEREAETIKSFRKIPHNLIIGKLLVLLENLANHPESVHKIFLAQKTTED